VRSDANGHGRPHGNLGRTDGGVIPVLPGAMVLLARHRPADEAVTKAVRKAKSLARSRAQSKIRANHVVFLSSETFPLGRARLTLLRSDDVRPQVRPTLAATGYLSYWSGDQSVSDSFLACQLA